MSELEFDIVDADAVKDNEFIERQKRAENIVSRLQEFDPNIKEELLSEVYKTTVH
jgi:hypothetical protein